MLKHFDSSLSFINNETKIALYIEIAKPLILTLPDNNDKVKAIAWFRKIIFDNSNILVRIEYLELLLKFLKHRKLSGCFAGLPDTRRPLQNFSRIIESHQISKYDNKIKENIEAPIQNVDNDGDTYLPQKINCNRFRCKYMEVIHQVNKSEIKTQCLKRNNRISAGYSPLTKREIKHEIKNIMKSPGDYNKNINKCKAMLTINSLPPITISNENELIRFGRSKAVGHKKREKYFNTYNVTPAHKNYIPTFQNDFCKHRVNCINRTACEYKYSTDEKLYQHVLGKNNKTIEKIPIKAKLKEENRQSKDLNEYCEISKNSELESFLMGSKKYLTLCVSKECLVERNILKCVKYIISNAQCKFFKFKEYSNSEKKYSLTKPKKTNDILRKYHTNSFLNNETGRKKRSSCTPENNQTFFFDNSYLTRLRNFLSDNITLENVSDTIPNMIGKCIYMKISLILAVGSIFFWKLYQIIFACQCKKVGFSTQIVSQISNYRKNVCSPYIFTFVGCFIMYQLVKDFINIFIEPY